MPKRPRSEEDGSQMKLLNWFADKQPTNSPSEKTNDGSSRTSAAPIESSFQTTSKVYKFQEKWKTNRSWVHLVTHLQQVCNSGTRVSKELAKSFLKTLKSPKFVMYLNFFSAYLKLLSALSKVFQGNHHTIETVVAKLRQ